MLKQTTFIAALSIGLFMASPIFAKTVTDHAGNRVEIPTNPKRIASLHTMSTTAMLWELQVPLIGTATRPKKNENNRPYIRAVEETFNIKFQDTGLANYGSFGKDIEQIKASKPDLIVGTVAKHAKVYKKLSAIAPTVLIDHFSSDMFNVYRDLSSWVGKDDFFIKNTASYKNRLKDVAGKFSIAPNKQTVAYVMGRPGKAQYSARIHYGAFTEVAYDLGFKPLPFMVAQFKAGSKGGNLSAETFGKMNPNWILSTFRNQIGENIDDVYKALDDVAPGWRSYNKAYKNKQVVAINRELSYPMTFKTLNWVLDQFEKHAK